MIGRAYGMVAPNDNDSATVRTTFFIDPTGVIRAMTCYPANVGRSTPEMLRMLDALQAGNPNPNPNPQSHPHPSPSPSPFTVTAHRSPLTTHLSRSPSP